LGDADVRAGGGAAGPLVLQRLDTAQPLPFFGQPLPLVGEQPLGGGDALGLAGDVVEPEDASDAHDLSPLSSGGGPCGPPGGPFLGAGHRSHHTCRCSSFLFPGAVPVPGERFLFLVLRGRFLFPGSGQAAGNTASLRSDASSSSTRERTRHALPLPITYRAVRSLTGTSAASSPRPTRSTTSAATSVSGTPRTFRRWPFPVPEPFSTPFPERFRRGRGERGSSFPAPCPLLSGTARSPFPVPRSRSWGTGSPFPVPRSCSSFRTGSGPRSPFPVPRSSFSRSGSCSRDGSPFPAPIPERLPVPRSRSCSCASGTDGSSSPATSRANSTSSSHGSTGSCSSFPEPFPGPSSSGSVSAGTAPATPRARLCRAPASARCSSSDANPSTSTGSTDTNTTTQVGVAPAPCSCAVSRW